MKKRLECDVYGHVQGVFFRGFCAGIARNMNIVGYAQNIEDGSVHIVAEGDKNVLEQFIREIRRGNKYSKVEKFVSSWGVVSNEFDDFNIA